VFVVRLKKKKGTDGCTFMIWNILDGGFGGVLE
jgi:hypothetical protein